MRSDGAFVEVQHAGDLLIAQASKKLQGDDVAAAGWQRGDAGAEVRKLLLAQHGAVRRKLMRPNLRQFVQRQRFVTDVVLAVELADLIVRDAEQPRRQRSITAILEAAPSSDSLHKYLRHHILRV